MSQVWNKLRKITGKYVPKNPPVLELNGSEVANPKEVGDAFADHFANVSRKNEEAPYFAYRTQEEQFQINFKTNKQN